MLRSGKNLRYVWLVVPLFAYWAFMHRAQLFPWQKHGEKVRQALISATDEPGSRANIRGDPVADPIKPGSLSRFATELQALPLAQRRPLWEIQVVRMRGLKAEAATEIDAFISENIDVDLGLGDSLEDPAHTSTLRVGLIILLGKIHEIDTDDSNLSVLQATASVIEAWLSTWFLFLFFFLFLFRFFGLLN